MAALRRVFRFALIGLAVVACLFVALLLAWGADTNRNPDQVARNVTLAGRPVGGLSGPSLAAAVQQVADSYKNSKVVITAEKGSIDTDTNALGVTVDAPSTTKAVLRVGRDGALPGRVWSWVQSFLNDRRATVDISVDANAAWKVVPKLDTGPRTNPVEPNIKVEGDNLVAVAGVLGKGIDPAEVLGVIPDVAKRGVPIIVPVHRGTVHPRFSTSDAEKIAAEGTSLTRSSLTVTAGGQNATIPTKALRSWLRAEPTDDGHLVLAVNAGAAADDLGKLLPKVGTAPVETKFDLVNDVPTVIPGKPGLVCCSPSAGPIIERALRNRPTTPPNLPLKPADPQLTEAGARALGIKERVSTFTTPHAAGEPRVVNIHLIADIVRGAVIKPGETFSINTFVGKRTAERGFVVAPVIANGKHDEDVGGGISQFATTTFNAAFFAGLDYGEYQSHSLYISRYPFGREATMGFPHPDLQIKNTTPYGILIWPTYTGTSLTVSFYSTHFVDATQSAQSQAPYGKCTRVTTERTRKYVDGTTKVDKVFALYQPAEGELCP
jgi:vancomycin resistance protein YoaR